MRNYPRHWSPESRRTAETVEVLFGSCVEGGWFRTGKIRGAIRDCYVAGCPAVRPVRSARSGQAGHKINLGERVALRCGCLKSHTRMQQNDIF